MRHVRVLLASVLLVAAGVVSVARGQEMPGTKRVAFTGDLGFVKTGGNTDLMTLSISEKVEYQTGSPLVLQQSLSWVLGRTEGEESANQLRTGLRGTYPITDGLSAYAGASYYRDRFAGVAKRFDESVGLGYQVIDSERHALRFEGGISFFQETLTTGLTDQFTAGRAAGKYRYNLGEKAYLEQSLDYLPNFDNGGDYRIAGETTLVAPLNSVLALKVGYLARYRGEPPAGFDNTDTTFRTSIQVTF